MRKLLFATFLAVILLAIPAQLTAYSLLETTYTDWEFDWASWNGWNGDNHVYDYASYVDLYEGAAPDGYAGGVLMGTQTGLLTSINWGHTLPNLTVPPDQVTAAKLWINAWEIDQWNNSVRIDGYWQWNPLNQGWWDSNSNTVYDLTYGPNYWSDGTLDVTVAAGERKLRIDGAVLMMDYCQETPPPPSVPEPGTLLLLGLGLTAVGVIRKRSK